MTPINRAALLVALGLWLAALPAFAKARPLIISTMPFDSPSAQRAVFGLLSRHLGKALDRPVKFEAGKSYSEVIARLKAGKVDVAIIGAAAYIQARRSGDVRAILRTVRNRNQNYHGIVVVEKGSELTQLGELKGKRFAFVDKSSTAGYFFARRLLKKAGLDPDTDVEAVFAGGHHQVVNMVANGKVDAGACFDGAQETLADPEAVTAIARTEAILGDPVVVRAGLGADLIKTLRSTMIELAMVPDAKNFFIYSEIDGFMPAYDSEYDETAKLIAESGG